MSSSSSDSDSDDFEPIRKIKINIRPKEDVVRRGAADVSEIRASVEAWRPLGPPPHPSLSRRQSSLSSVSSMSFGVGSIYGSSSGTTTSVNPTNLSGLQASNNTGMLSSPSCSSLVNEFGNRASFTNLLSMTSKIASPLAPTGQFDVVPVAIAIQESIELIVKGNIDPQSSEPEFSTRAMGNIKVAFPNAFAKGFCSGKNYPDLKFKLHPTDKITRYLMSRLIKETDTNPTPTNGMDTNSNSTTNGESRKQITNAIDLLDLDIAPKSMETNAKIIDFDMKELNDHLRRSYEQSPVSKYYNVDVLRYQISPITSIEESPLQVCAYWKLETKCVKLRIYFKQSSRSGLNLDRFRDISFVVDLSNYVPQGITVDDISSSTRDIKSTSIMNFSAAYTNPNNLKDSSKLPPPPPPLVARTQITTSKPSAPDLPARLAPPPVPAARSSIGTSRRAIKKSDDTISMELPASLTLSAFDAPPKQHSSEARSIPGLESDNSLVDTGSILGSTTTLDSRALISSEPHAHWDNSTKQLVWKFDNLVQSGSPLSGSLLAKLDYRSFQDVLPTNLMLTNIKPPPVEIKFVIPDSSLSNVGIDIESVAYKVSLQKREVRTGRYKSEPCVS